MSRIPIRRGPRLLPFTMATMLVLLGVKAILLVHGVLLGLPTLQLVSPANAASVATPPAAAPPVAASPAAVPAPEQPPVSDGERALLLDLRQRRVELDQRSAGLDARAEELAAAGQRLSARLDELTALQSRLQALEDQRKQREAQDWDGLVKLYETMKPADAATIFNDLDMAVLLPVVDRMKDAKAAAILAAMDPVRARLVTTSLADYRLRANTVAGG